MIVSEESVPVWKLAVSAAVNGPAGDQFAAVDHFLFAPPPVHVNVSAAAGSRMANDVARNHAAIRLSLNIPIVVHFFMLGFLLCGNYPTFSPQAQGEKRCLLCLHLLTRE